MIQNVSEIEIQIKHMRIITNLDVTFQVKEIVTVPFNNLKGGKTESPFGNIASFLSNVVSFVVFLYVVCK